MLAPLLGLIGRAFTDTYIRVSVRRVGLPWKTVRTSRLPTPGRTVQETSRASSQRAMSKNVMARQLFIYRDLIRTFFRSKMSRISSVSGETVVFEDSLIVSLLPKPNLTCFSLGVLMPQQLREKQSPLVCCLRSKLLYRLVSWQLLRRITLCKHQAQ